MRDIVVSVVCLASFACGAPSLTVETASDATASDDAPEASAEPYPELTVAEGTLRAVPISERYATVHAHLEGVGYRLLSERDVTLAPSRAVEVPLSVEGGRCYAVTALARATRDRLLLRLTDPTGRVLAANHGDTPGVWYCPPDRAELTIHLSNDALPVSGQLLVYVGDRDAEPRLRELVGGNCDAVPGRGPVFPDGADDLGARYAAGAEGWDTIDLADREAWRSLYELSGPTRLLVDAEMLSDAPNTRHPSLLSRIATAATCVPVVLTVSMDSGTHVVPFRHLAQLTHLRGLHFVSRAGTRGPSLDFFSMRHLRALEGLAVLDLEGVGMGDDREWVPLFPRLRYFRMGPCAYCSATAGGIEALTRLPALTELYVYSSYGAEEYPRVVDALARMPALRAAQVSTGGFFWGRIAPPATRSERAVAMHEALSSDRVARGGLFSIGTAYDAETGIVTHDATRVCGEEARRAVHELGDDWVCTDAGCVRRVCSTTVCEQVQFDGDAVLAIVRPADAWVHGRTVPITAEGARRLEARTACGATTTLRDEDLR